MQVNTIKLRTWHSGNTTKYNVNKSYHTTTGMEDEYEDDMYEDTEDEYTEDEYTEEEDTEDEFKEEYNNSVYYRKRGQDTQEWLENYRAYHSRNQSTKQPATLSTNLLAHQSEDAKIQSLQKRVSEQNNQALSTGEIQNLLVSESGRNYLVELLQQNPEIMKILEEYLHHQGYNLSQDQECKETTYKQECQEPAYQGSGNQKNQLGDQRSTYQPEYQDLRYHQSLDKECQGPANRQEYQEPTYIRVGNQQEHQLGYQRSTYQQEYQDQGYHQSQDQECKEPTYQQECQEPACQGLGNQQGHQLGYQESANQPLGITADQHTSDWLWYNKEPISGRGRPPEERSKSAVVRKPVDTSS